ncbi:hypothetical protein HW450_08435 [Corynebacterium hindlerae]|uniref:Uncharacterized protein n=1 Tax=Corynebacterium hindlerae TaxID=699041 RepID=A0A7G5FCQ5_9CORY|nr:hypothetical protein [Corynebacterium hindlerae]QMV84396.1 hypothetical protein HW450_08435 [Corynebacterium hindlerae]QTH59697.1 hypothetical protein J5O04_00670 [Corynebacterium hindlerae]
MFGFLKKKAPTEHTAATMTNTPLSNELTMMLAQELPLLDSQDRVRVYEILENYDGPTITTQDDLPTEIKDLLDLY